MCSGTLDKFLGDGFMATFGSFREESDAAARAIACAFELYAEIERWNAKRAAREAQRLSIAIGVHFGPVVVGNLGSDERLEFTVVGDVVNVASRLEEATRELDCMIAVSDVCVQAAGPAHLYEGFEKAVACHTVEDVAETLLRNLRNGLDRLPVHPDVDEVGCGR